MSAPETLEELRAALVELADEWRGQAADGGEAIPARSAYRKAADHLFALLPPAPEPIKVGDRVRSQGNTLGSVTDVGPLRVWWDGLNHLPPETIDDERAATLTRVDPSPSPEPERKQQEPGGAS